MRGEVPKVGDIVFATLAGAKVSAKVSAKVGGVTDPPRSLRGQVIIEVHADEI
jgi:hypothetical protein